MSIQIKVPALGESVTEATIARWLKKEGDPVSADEPVVELETDKVSLEVPSPAAGVLERIEVAQGATVGVGAVLGAVRKAPPQRPKPSQRRRKQSPQPLRPWRSQRLPLNRLLLLRRRLRCAGLRRRKSSTSRRSRAPASTGR